MLFEGKSEGLGPTLAARKFGYTEQRYFQLLERFEAQGALALQSKARRPRPTIGAPKRWFARSFVIVSAIRMVRARSSLKSASKPHHLMVGLKQKVSREFENLSIFRIG
jgi:hypothetical protein